MISCEDEASVNLRTVLGRIFNSAALSLLKRQLSMWPSIRVGVIAVLVLLPLGEA